MTGIGDYREIEAGSTGRKAMLSVDYDEPAPELPTELFVKFSRDFDDPVRDRGRTQMESEVRFAVLSRAPRFPIAVPRPQFADYHRRTGTGILITERIMFGANGVERQYHKCLDYEMPEPLEHYRALLVALARLAGTHRAGGLPAALTAHFPLDVRAATVGPRAAHPGAQLGRRVAELGRVHPDPPRAGARRGPLTRVPGAADPRGSPLGGVRKRGCRPPGGRRRLRGAVPLERQRRLGLTPDGGHLTGGTAGPAGRLSVCRASVGSTPRSFGSTLPAW